MKAEDKIKIIQKEFEAQLRLCAYEIENYSNSRLKKDKLRVEMAKDRKATLQAMVKKITRQITKGN